MTPQTRQIRASFDDRTIRVYQAYSSVIAEAALKNGRFCAPSFSFTRMTWIKPSFLWMMYRSGWGFKDPGQARLLAIDIKRDGFEWAMKNACLSEYIPDVHVTRSEWKEQLKKAPVRVQWDPERSIHLEALPYRAIQIGLKEEAVHRYVEDWIEQLTDITGLAQEIHRLVSAGQTEKAITMIPSETLYPIDPREVHNIQLCGS